MDSNPLAAHSLNVRRPVKASHSDTPRIRETSLRNGTVKNKTGSNYTMITEQKPPDANACERLNPHPHVNGQAAAAHLQKYGLPTTPREALTTAEEEGMESKEKEAVRIALKSSKGDQDDGTLNPESAEGIVIQLCVRGMCFTYGV